MLKKKFGRIKKRTFVVLAICLIALILPVIFLFSFSKNEVDSSNVAVFSLEGESSRQLVQGIGLNILSPDNGNIITNNSFEPIVYRQNLTIDSGNNNSLKVAMPNDPQIGIYSDNFFVGARANVISFDSDGNRSLKKSGRIKEYLSDQIDDFRPLSMPADLPNEILWSDLAEKDMEIALAGNKGYILTIDSFSETSLFRLPKQENVVGIGVFDDHFIALDQKGNFYSLDNEGQLDLSFTAIDYLTSIDTEKNNADEQAKTYEELEEITKEKSIEWFDLATRKDAEGNWQFMAVGQNGHYIYGNEDEYQLGQLDLIKNIRSVTSNTDGFYLVGDDSLALYTKNGENFRYLEIPTRGNWSTVSSRGRQVMIAGEQGQVVYSQDGLSYQNLSNESIREISIQFTETHEKSENETIVFNPNFISCSILSNNQLMLIDSRGLMYYSDDMGENWESVSDLDYETSLDYSPRGMNFNMVRRTSSGQLLATTTNGYIHHAMMGLRIELDSSLEQGNYENGDILEIEQVSAYPVFQLQVNEDKNIEGEWYVSDINATEIQFFESAPGGGQSSLAINLSSNNKNSTKLTGIYTGQEIEQKIQTDSFNLQQKLSNETKEKIKNNTIFSYEFWAKTESNTPALLTLSLTNIDLQYEQVKREIAGDWQKYQGVFLLPKNAIREDKEHRLDISFSGSGKIYIDSIWIGLSENIRKELTSSCTKELPATPIMRFDFMPVGNPKYPRESWLQTDKAFSFFYQNNSQLELINQANIVSSLEMCNKNRANPWLIIDSQTTDTEIKHFIQYLFGQQNTSYGELRMQDGAMGRYSDTFKQIYFEIIDQCNYFENDWQKQSYVNWVIQVISETPEYLQIKNNIIFVDGMSYKDDIAMSNADYHASDISLDQRILNIDQLSILNSDFNEHIPRDPGRGMYPRSELIRSTALDGEELRLADVVVSGLTMLGDKKEVALLDFDLSSKAQDNNFASAYSQIGNHIAGMSPYKTSSKNIQDKVLAFAFGRNDLRTIVLINLSEKTMSCQLSNLNLRDFEQTIYDNEGSMLETLQIKREKQMISLLPGGVVVLYGELNGK